MLPVHRFVIPSGMKTESRIFALPFLYNKSSVGRSFDSLRSLRMTTRLLLTVFTTQSSQLGGRVSDPPYNPLWRYPMAKSEMAIFTNMCMVYDDAGNILVQDRKNPDWPGITFPGGHVEPGESFVESVIREVWEETGLTVENPVLCGAKQFQTEDDARYVVLFYKTNRFSGSLKSSDEGEVFWIPRDTLTEYSLSIDFEEMVQIFESDSLSEFYYFIEDGKWNRKLL